MALGNYSELQTSIAGWLDNSALTAFIPDFIALAEASMGRRLRLLEQEASATLNVTAGEATLPANFVEAIALRTSSASATPLAFKSRRTFALDLDLGGSEPVSYTYSGSTLLLAPKNDVDVFLEYYTKIPALSVGSPTNWLLTMAPDAYLYGALQHSAPFLRDDERVEIWTAGYERAMGETEKQDQRKRFSGSTLVAKPRRAF